MARVVPLLVLLAALAALPFWLRPTRDRGTSAERTVVVITAHNEAIRYEFGRGFAQWYRARTGQSVAVEWRVIGGASEITRFLESSYVAAFRDHWSGQLGREWSVEVASGFARPTAERDGTETVHEARTAFLESEVSCGIDVFFGGSTYEYVREAEAGRLVPMRIFAAHPEWFADDVIPQRFAGEEYWDRGGRWVGNVVSSYGILYHRAALRRLGLDEPRTWSDLADPRLLGEVALADPTRSSSMAKAFENVIQQAMQRRALALAADASPAEAREEQAVRVGWIAGLRLLQQIAANARYFTDSSQKPPIDVGQGDCAVGVCIDFYGRAQAESTRRRAGGDERLGFVTPRGGTVGSVDPIGILRGAPRRDLAEAFVEYTLTMDAQKLWNFQPGTPGGPHRYALRRMPVRRDFYSQVDWLPLRSDPTANPYGDSEQLRYRPERTAHLFRELAFIVRVMALDTHTELVRAWRAIAQAPEPAQRRALAVLHDLNAVDHEQARTTIKAALSSRYRTDELRLARQLGDVFRANYAEAERLARQP